MSVEKLKTAVKAFEATQSKYAKFGAYDTEPDGAFQVTLVRAFLGKDSRLPRTADTWELYSDMATGQAVRSLNAKAQKCVDIIGNTPIKDRQPLEQYLRDYCWRVTWPN